MLGFRNLGNTCYLNSVLSIITQCSSFDTLFKDYTAKTVLTPREQSADQLVKSFQQLVSLKKDVQKDRAGLINPSGIYTYLFQYLKHRQNSLLLPQRQNDAMECLNICLDVFEEASASSMEKMWNDGVIRRDIVRLKDNKVVDTTEEQQIAWNIHIPVIEPNKPFKPIKISELIMNTYDNNKSETINYKRDGDSEPQDYMIRRTVKKTPQLFILSLSRWDNFGNKIGSPVQLEEEIQILDKKYRLRGVICHMGHNMLSGHYYSIVSHSTKEGQYFMIDDMNIRVVPSIDMTRIQAHAYGVIYQLC